MMLLESNRFDYKEVNDLFKAIPFFAWELVRELLVRLAEFGFKFISPCVFRILMLFFHAWGSSLPSELGFKAVRHRASAAENNKIGNNTSWLASSTQSTFRRSSKDRA